MPKLKIEWECRWDQRKIRLIQREVQMALRILGGVSNVSPIMSVEETQAEPVQKPNIILQCKRYDGHKKAICGKVWESEIFTPCPACGNRKFVTKIPSWPKSNSDSPQEAAATPSLD